MIENVDCLVITGSREWKEKLPFLLALEDYPRRTRIVRGCCPRGADFLAKVAAMELGFYEVVTYHANWDLGLGMGPKRNELMLTREHQLFGARLGVLAFPERRADGKRSGTEGAMEIARSLGIRMEVTWKGTGG